MSEQASPQREWRFYIADMVGFAEKVLAYTEGLSQDAFSARDITYDAVLRNLELIGEAATRVPEEVRESSPEVPWRIVIATRNRLIHTYLGIDDGIIWDIVQNDVPRLLAALQRLRGAANL